MCNPGPCLVREELEDELELLPVVVPTALSIER